MLAEAFPADLCTHAIAFFAKRPIKASDDAWKGLRANRSHGKDWGGGSAGGQG